MKLLGGFLSPYVRRTAVSLDLTGLNWESVQVSVWDDPNAVKQHNPLVRVPTLVLDDGEALVASRDGQRFGLETAWQLVRPYLNTPAQVQRLLTLAENGRLRVQTDRDTLRQYERIEKRIGQLGWSILGAAGMLSGTLLYLNRKEKEKGESDK